MTVGEVYKEINLDWISEQAEENDYYNTCDKFLLEVWDKPIEAMTPKQIKWLDKIQDACLENQK